MALALRRASGLIARRAHAGPAPAQLSITAIVRVTAKPAGELLSHVSCATLQRGANFAAAFSPPTAGSQR